MKIINVLNVHCQIALESWEAFALPSVISAAIPAHML
jgi:hypothetical protein